MAVTITDPQIAAELRAAIASYLHALGRAGARSVDLEQLARHLGALAAGQQPAPARPIRPWISVDEAAALAGVSERTIRRAVQRGELPHRRIGRRLLIDRQALT